MAADLLSMLQLDIDARHLARLAHRQNMPRDQDDLGYPIHALLSDLFGQGAAQPFRIVDSDRATVHLLAYSATSEDRLRQHATTFADPASHQACNWHTLAVKQMPTSWAAGQRLGFSLRACPVVRLARPLEVPDKATTGTISYKKGSELDAWQHRLHTGPARIDRAEAYRDWLAERLTGAADLTTCTIRAFRRVHLARKTQGTSRRFKTLERPDALLEGELEIRDGQAFANLLARGVGRHTAFGFGMLLLRPPRSRG